MLIICDQYLAVGLNYLGNPGAGFVWMKVSVNRASALAKNQQRAIE
jgi:hypothetical protein